MKAPLALALLSLVATQSNFRESDSSASLSIASYNILADRYGNGWKLRRASVNHFVAANHPDILALQEVTERQMGDIARANSAYSYAVGERSDGMRGDQPWYEYNPILFNSSRLELVLASSFWVSDSPSVPGSILPGTKKHARVLSWALLRERRTGIIILVGNVHIHGLRGADEIKIIMTQLSRLAHRGPVVILGDFNAAPDGPAYAWMTRKASQFKDAAAGMPDQNQSTLIGPDGETVDGGKTTAKVREVDDRKRIDYIFTCGFPPPISYKVIDNRIDFSGLHASDHLPIVAIFNGLFYGSTGCFSQYESQQSIVRLKLPK